MSIKSLWSLWNAFLIWFLFPRKSSFHFKTIMVSVFCHIFIQLNVFLKTVSLPCLYWDCYYNYNTTHTHTHTHTNTHRVNFPWPSQNAGKQTYWRSVSMADLFAHYKIPPNNSCLNLLQPGPILQQSCLGLQIMSLFCSLLSLRYICVKQGAGGITCFTSIDRKKLVTTSFLL